MTDDIQQFKLDFETNAKQVAEHLREVVELLQKISNQIDRNFALRLSRMKKSRAMQKGEIDMTKKRVKAETDANKKISDAEKKVGKTQKANADASRRNETQELVRLGKIAAAWGIINHLAQKAYAKNKEFASISWAAKTANVPTNQVIALKSAGSGEGVDYQSAGNVLTQMRRASSMMKRGLMPFAEANARFTQQVQDVLFSNGKMTNDPMDMLRRIAGAMDTIRDVGDKMYFGELMGLSADMTRFLSKGLANFDRQIADGMKNAPELAKEIDAARNRQQTLEEIKQGFDTFAGKMLKILDFLPEDKKTLQNIGEAVAAISASVAIIAAWRFFSPLLTGGAAAAAGGAAAAAGGAAAATGAKFGISRFISSGLKPFALWETIFHPTEMGDGDIYWTDDGKMLHGIDEYNEYLMKKLNQNQNSNMQTPPRASNSTELNINIPLTVYGDNPQQVEDAVKNGLDRALTMWDIASVDAMYSRGDKA